MGKYPLQDSVTVCSQTSRKNIIKKAPSTKAVKAGVQKTKPSKKAVLVSQPQVVIKRAEMLYYDQIMTHVFSHKSYPQKPQGKQKIKKDVKALLKQVTYLDGDGYLFEKCFDMTEEDQRAPFKSAQITLEMRSQLIGWVSGLHKALKHRQETFHLAVTIIDQFCVDYPVLVKQYQLLGLVALLMAAKYEETQTPVIDHFLKKLNDDEQFQKQKILAMQSRVLIGLNFDLGRRVSSLWFLEAFGKQQVLMTQRQNSKKSKNEEDKQNMPILQCYRSDSSSMSSDDNFHERYINKCRYFLNLIMMEYPILKKYGSDVIAISVLIYKAMGRNAIDVNELESKFLKIKSQAVEGKNEFKREIRKCMYKIQKIWKNRFDSKYWRINQKFNVVPKK